MRTTDIYPTRYAALDNPGPWWVFRPAKDGTFRHCREDAPRRPVDTLGVWPDNGAELAVICHADGGYAEVRSTGRGGFFADVSFGNAGNIVKADTLKGAMRKAESALKRLRKEQQEMFDG